MARLFGLRPQTTASRHWDYLFLAPRSGGFMASAPNSRAIYGMVSIWHNKSRSHPVSRVLCLCDHLSGTRIAPCLKRRMGARHLSSFQARTKNSNRARRPCSRWGLPVISVSADPVRSYFKPRRTAPFRPYPLLPRKWGREAVCFCGTFRRVAPPGR